MKRLSFQRFSPPPHPSLSPISTLICYQLILGRSTVVQLFDSFLCDVVSLFSLLFWYLLLLLIFIRSLVSHHVRFSSLAWFKDSLGKPSIYCIGLVLSFSSSASRRKLCTSVLSCIPSLYHCDHRCVASDYIPTFRLLCHSERLREAANVKRR